MSEIAIRHAAPQETARLCLSALPIESIDSAQKDLTQNSNPLVTIPGEISAVCLFL